MTGFWVAALPACALALSSLEVEKAAVGQRTLVLTVDDSIHAPDLSRLLIEGYEIESAVFLEEKEDAPLVFTPGYLDMTSGLFGRVAEFLPAPGVLFLDAPPAVIPGPGTVLADTSFGGLFRKVTRVEGAPHPSPLGRRWVLHTVEAELPDALVSGELSFHTRLDLNQALPDLDRADEASGYLPDGTAAFGEAGFGLRKAQVLFQPSVTGRIRVEAGRVEAFEVEVRGDCEVMAEVRGSLKGRGEFEIEEELAARAPSIIPLGHGLFLRAGGRPAFRMEADVRGESFAAAADFRVRNSLKGDLAFGRGEWRPMAENQMSASSRAVKELRGDGSMRISIRPRLEFLFAGIQGPAFTFETYARFAAAGAGPSEEPAAPSGGLRAAVPGAAPPPLQGSRELSLGADIVMRTRTTFSGPPIHRDFVLFSREQSLLSAPREGALALKEADSGRVFLSPLTYPKSDRYLVQAKAGNGPWETLLDVPASPRIRVGNLKPGTAYRFRVIGANSMGLGPAFPPEGVPYATPLPNRPPRQPHGMLPDSAATVPGTSPVLSWKGGDPDPDGRVAYTVYLDRRFPPQAVKASGLADSSLALAGLEPGATYYWKVEATDGRATVEGPIRSFTVEGPGTDPRPAAPSPAGYPMAHLPRGSFLREDGRDVVVGPFRMGVYEVTQAEFELVMGRNPSYRLQDSLPVERVTWGEAAAFCREIGGRLPTEAEWEYAARAGSSGRFYWGSGDAGEYAWYRDNSDNRSRKVGGKKPNGWGLHDMAGNVFEWVEDWYGEYSAVSLDHPRGPESGVAKVIRGASWYSEGESLDLGSRYNNRPGFRNFKVGFRCAMDAESGTASDGDARPPRSGEAAPDPEGAEPDLRGGAGALPAEEPAELSGAPLRGPHSGDEVRLR